MPINPETAIVTIELTMPDFERVFEVLKSFKEFNLQMLNDPDSPVTLPAEDRAWIEDTIETINNLKFTFKEASES